MAFRSPASVMTGVIVAALALSACGGAKRALGLQKTAPDEFAVVNHGPLVMPPDYDLRPPVPGADRPQELPASEQARAVLLGRAKLEALRSQGLSKGEVGLLAKAGTDQVLPNVRDSLNKESSVFANEQKSFTDRLLFWRDSDASPDVAATLDPAAEQRRLSENQALGKKPNEGPTPVITKGGKFLGVF
ncbi:MAG: DUF3035 domain-containing protein [Rhodospirillaceae bacterium]|nr:MAG: DUF3035 domain-containing protein [Rhodospirillaceae bacterium]